MNTREALIESTALVTAVAAAAGAAAGTIALARGETTGAPGITKALARIGRSVGGSMLTGIALVGGFAGLVGIAVCQGLRQVDG
jgi:hypothetical protein